MSQKLTTQEQGARSGWIIDPFGHRWNIQTTVEHVSTERLRERVGDQSDITG
jgi:PhnB protein